MRIIFLGTGTSMGVPVIACGCKACKSVDSHDRRMRTSALIQTNDGKNILIDIGPDFRTQMLRHDVSHLDAILITHSHRDHVGGLDDIRAFNYIQRSPMQLYGNQEALDMIRHDYHYIFEPHEYEGLPEAYLNYLTGNDMFEAAGHTIVPIKAMHKTLPVLGYRIGNLVYITDANHIEPTELDKVKGCDTLVLNALRKERHFSHFSLPEALQIISQVGPRQAFLTHISHDMGLSADVQPMLPDHVRLAWDGLEADVR
ncbi:MAG: MBL fold metallo-hydrolase [Bacteroidales bacterium]|nr:MBL fold metallo-hydrolase [Candidatus Colimorpha onthohippi]